MRKRINFKWQAPHHIYIGIFLVLLGWLMSLHELYSAVYIWFYIIGIFLTIDDLIEHLVTGDTPFRLLFEKIIVPYLKKL